jgi:hypothetical protein
VMGMGMYAARRVFILAYSCYFSTSPTIWGGAVGAPPTGRCPVRMTRIDCAARMETARFSLNIGMLRVDPNNDDRETGDTVAQEFLSRRN